MKPVVFNLTLILLMVSCSHAGDAFKSYGPEITESRYTGEFERIQAGEKFDITLVQDTSKAGTVEITAGKNVISGYTSKVINGELKLLNENKFNWVRNLKIRQKVTVYFKTLNELNIGGSAKFVSAGTIVSNSTININHGGLEDADLRIKGDYIYANCTNTGGVILKGSCFLLSASVDDISFVHALELEAEKCFISSFSKEKSLVNGVKELEIKLFGTGDILYKATPSSTFKVEQKGTGRVYLY